MLKPMHPVPTENELALQAIKTDAQRIIDNIARLHGKLCALDQSRLETATMHLETSIMWIEKGVLPK